MKVPRPRHLLNLDDVTSLQSVRSASVRPAPTYANFRNNQTTRSPRAPWVPTLLRGSRRGVALRFCPSDLGRYLARFDKRELPAPIAARRNGGQLESGLDEEEVQSRQIERRVSLLVRDRHGDGADGLLER